jgi:hypothetical protein
MDYDALTDEDLLEIEKDPIKLEAYFWRVAIKMRQIPQLKDCSRIIVENMDSFVKSSLNKDKSVIPSLLLGLIEDESK